MCGAPPGGTKGGKSSVQSTEEGIKLKRSNEHLPVIDEPFVADALGLEGVGEELAKARVARLPQRQRALDGATHVALLGPLAGGEGGTCGEGCATRFKLRPLGNARTGPGKCMGTQHLPHMLTRSR